MSSSVCYIYFSPVIDKRQPICYAVKYWTVIFNTNFFVFDSTLVTKENLNFKTNAQQQWVGYARMKLIFNEFVECAETYMLLGYNWKNFPIW